MNRRMPQNTREESRAFALFPLILPTIWDSVLDIPLRGRRVSDLGGRAIALSDEILRNDAEYEAVEDARDLPANVDCVVALSVFQALTDDDEFRAAIRDVFDALGPDGRLVVCDLQPTESPPEGTVPRGPLAFIEAWPSGGLHVTAEDHDGHWVGWLDKKKRGEG